MKLHYDGIRSMLALGVAVSVFLTPFGVSAASAYASRPQTKASAAPVTRHTHASPHQSIGEDVDSFIVEMIDGVATCRAATADEVTSTLPKAGDEGVPVEHFLPNLVGSGGDKAENALTINLVALSQLQTDANAAVVTAAIQRAAAVWTAQIKSPVTITINIDYGFNSPGGGPFGPNTLGSTGSNRILVDYSGVRTNLIAGASSPAEAALYNSLPTSFLPTDVGNGAVVAVNRSAAYAMGLPISNPSNTVVATMGFNKAFPFDFNPDDGITFNQTDFVAVAIHEIGHALGFTSGAGSDPSTATPTLWDLFRFRPGTTTGTFTTAQRVMVAGGEQNYFTGQTFDIENGLPTTEPQLSTGGPSGSAGDGRQSSHWKDNALTGRFVGIMDPTIGPGTHEEAHPNDFLTIETLGWNLVSSVAPPPAPPPPPPPANDNFASAQVITGCSGSVTGANVGASSEIGEPNHLSTTSDPEGGGAKSIWYRWQAPSNSAIEITTAGSRFDTILGVYVGNSVNALTVIGQHDDVGGPQGADKTSRVAFNAVAGQTYRIAVDGYANNTEGDFGPVTLNWNMTTCGAAVQISSSSFNVSESSGTLNINVTRTGDTSVAATVNYATTDSFGASCNVNTGTASAKCDFNTAGGTLRFAAGETSKTITLSIVNDGYVEGNETFVLTLSSPTGAILGSPATTTITVLDNDGAGSNPFETNSFFVRQQYLDFLLREPDSGGFNDWMNVLTNCAPNQGGLGSDPACDRVHVSSGFFRSTEFGERGYWAYRYYHAALGRRPLFAEFLPDMRRLSVPQAEEEVARGAFISDFMQRAEFQTIYTGLTSAANAAQFIAKLEEKAEVTLPATTTTLPGQPPQYGRNELIQKMASGEFTAAQTLRAFIEQKVVFDRFFFRAFVAMQYFGYLLRDPEDAGYNDWVDVLTNGRGNIPPGDFRHLIFGFVWSVEYRQRFGP
jgi:Calx-beta domain